MAQLNDSDGQMLFDFSVSVEVSECVAKTQSAQIIDLSEIVNQRRNVPEAQQVVLEKLLDQAKRLRW